MYFIGKYFVWTLKKYFSDRWAAVYENFTEPLSINCHLRGLWVTQGTVLSGAGMNEWMTLPRIWKLGPPTVDRPAGETLVAAPMGSGQAQNNAGSPCRLTSCLDLCWVIVPCQLGDRHRWDPWRTDSQNVTTLVGKKLEPVQETEQCQLDVVGLNLMHSTNWGTKLLDRGCTLSFVQRCQRWEVWGEFSEVV